MEEYNNFFKTIEYRLRNQKVTLFTRMHGKIVGILIELRSNGNLTLNIDDHYHYFQQQAWFDIKEFEDSDFQQKEGEF